MHSSKETTWIHTDQELYQMT